MLDEVRVLSAGFCQHPEAMTFRGASWRPCCFPNGFALLHHTRHGPILFDTGYSPFLTDEMRSWPSLLYGRLIPPRFAAHEIARNQLVALGVPPRDVRHIVISHFHADHIAGLRDFPRATLLCKRAAWRSVRTASGLQALVKGFIPGLMPTDTEERIAFVDDRPVLPLPPVLHPFVAGYDLFGDGTVVAVDLPGHAVGQIGAIIDERRTGPIFLVADAAWSMRAIAEETPPPCITTRLLGDTRAYRATLAKLSSLSHSVPQLRIIPSHCATGLAMTPR